MKNILILAKTEDAKQLLKKYSSIISSTPESVEFTPGYTKSFFCIKDDNLIEEVVNNESVIFYATGKYSNEPGSRSYYLARFSQEDFETKVKPTAQKMLEGYDELNFKENQAYVTTVVVEDGNLNITVIKIRNSIEAKDSFNKKRPIFATEGNVVYDVTQENPTFLVHFI